MNQKLSAIRFLAPASAAVVLLLSSLFVASGAATRSAQRETRQVEAGMVARSELAARIGQWSTSQLLASSHIAERDAATMAAIEGRLREARADLTSALEAAAQRDAADPAMRSSIGELRADIDAMSPALADVLDLSRANRDAEAEAKMLQLIPAFERLNAASGRLLETSHRDTVASAARSSAAQDRAMLWLSSLAAIATVLVAAILAAAIRDVRRRQEETWRMTARLEEQNRELDAFAARVAHDLRGPLSTIALAVGRLTERLPDERTTSDILSRSVGRMETLIRDLLALSQVDTQSPDAASDPAIVAASVGRDLSSPVADAGGRLELAVDDARVRCSEGLLRDVLWNLVENALKYRGAAPPAIRVEGHRSHDVYEIRVSDNGMGMSADDARHAFDPFFRGTRAPHAAEGTGLGLSIVKRIVEVSAGKIAIESRVDRGTTVIVDLPLATPA
jgi:signal transduction histidine kinase